MAWEYARNRTGQDRPWLFVYLFVHVLAGIGAVYAWFNRNKIAFSIVDDPSYLGDPNNCPLDGDLAAGLHTDENPDDDLSLFFQMSWKWMLLSVGLSSLLAVVLVLGFEKIPRILTFGCAYGSVLAMPLLAIGMMLSSGAPVSSQTMMCVLLGAGAGLAMLAWFTKQLLLTARLLKQAARCVNASPALIPTVLGFNFTQVLHLVPFLVAAAVAATNGDVIRNPAVTGEKDSVCFAASDFDDYSDGEKEVSCCTWSVRPWAGVYMVGVVVACVWVTSFYAQLRLFTIAGAAAQWYLEKAARNRTLTAARHGLTTSVGTICFSSLIITICQIIRAMADAADDGNRECSVQCVARTIARMIIDCLTEIVLAITEFATVQASITGEAFFSAARGVTDMLKKNAMNAVGMWVLPGRVLGFASLMLGGVWGFGNYFISHSRLAAMGRENAQTEAIIFGAITGMAAFVVVSYVAGVLQSSCVALFVCYAMDQEHNTMSDPEVHNAIKDLPTVGVLVENPDGGHAYGQPDNRPAPNAGNPPPRNGTNINEPLLQPPIV